MFALDDELWPSIGRGVKNAFLEKIRMTSNRTFRYSFHSTSYEKLDGKMTAGIKCTIGQIPWT